MEVFGRNLYENMWIPYNVLLSQCTDYEIPVLELYWNNTQTLFKCGQWYMKAN